MASDALDVTEAAGAVDALLGEGGQIGRDGLCTVEPCGRKPVAIIGGTGYVGRLLARRLLTHPTMCLGFIVGSKRSEGMVYQDVWEEKEAALMKNYGSQLWSAMPFPPQLAGIKVASLEAVLESDCKIAISCVAPDVGYIEDILTNAGCKVYSISPYKRSENLTVPEVNPSQIPHAVDKSLFKSPNCVSVGTTLALKAIDDAFGLCKASVCTFQSLSGRGDAMYPAELVQGNIYPVWNTKERTEVYIGNEICALVNLPHDCLTVRAHRVGVHIGHFVDVRVNVRCPELMTTVDAVNKAFDAFAPLGELCGPEMPSLPPKPLKVIHEVGAPRPATHNQEYGGMQVAVGNVKLDDGVWDLCFSLVVNNMIRGAYGAALLMAEYHLYLQSHPGACEKLLKQYRHLDTKQTLPEATPITGPASSIAGAVQIPAPVPAARTNTLTSAAALRASREACEADPAEYHAAVARSNLHWYHPAANAWLSLDEGTGKWSGWKADAATPFTLDDAPSGGGWSPWEVALDDGKAPFFEWFVGGLTSAAFNEVDRHVLSGAGGEAAFVEVGGAALAAAGGGAPIAEHCRTLTRKELLIQSALAATMLREAGLGQGDRVVFLLPHCIEHMVWIEAAKRIGAVYTSYPETISIASLAGRIFEAQAALAITSSAKSNVAGTSHKAMVAHAIMDYVSIEAVLRALRRVLPEQRWRSSHGHVDIKSVCEAIEASFKGEGAVAPKEVAAKLEVIFSMQPPLRDKATELAAHLHGEVLREHANRAATRMLVVPNPFKSQSNSPGTTPNLSHRVAGVANGGSSNKGSPALNRKSTASGSGSPGMHRTGGAFRAGGGSHRSEAPATTAAALGSLMVASEDLMAAVLPRFLADADVADLDELAGLPDTQLVERVWRVSHPVVLDSMHPKSIVYTSGSSGYKATGLVHDTGGYASNVANTMVTCFDATAGADVILTDAAPSWVTGQTYGITGPLTTRVTSVLLVKNNLVEGTIAQCFAAVVLQLKVTIFVASASFLKRALRNTWQAGWLQRQQLHTQLRVAASCGEPLSPAMHKLGMAVLCPNYINSYWASEHGAIIMATATFGNADHRVGGDASMHPLPWVNAKVWLPVVSHGEGRTGRRNSDPHAAAAAHADGRMRFTQAEPTETPTADTAASVAAKGKLKGRLVVTRPWPSMARTVWGDASLAGDGGWVGDLDTFRDHYWSSFAKDNGEPVMALDLADLACPWSNGAFSVLGHSREELRVGAEGDVVAAAELEAVLISASSDVIDCCVVALPDESSKASRYLAHGVSRNAVQSTPIGCVVLPENVELTEELTNELKKATHEALGALFVPDDFVQIPAIPRTHNSKPMRNVVQRLFLGDSSLTDVSEIANSSCLLELKAAINEWRFQQALPTLDERC